jgi:hypothetical protein
MGQLSPLPLAPASRSPPGAITPFIACRALTSFSDVYAGALAGRSAPFKSLPPLPKRVEPKPPAERKADTEQAASHSTFQDEFDAIRHVRNEVGTPALLMRSSNVVDPPIPKLSNSGGTRGADRRRAIVVELSKVIILAVCLRKSESHPVVRRLAPLLVGVLAHLAGRDLRCSARGQRPRRLRLQK